MSDPKPLTRKQLAKFLPDQESIRAFERLFEQAGTDTPIVIETILQQIGTARTVNQSQQSQKFDEAESRQARTPNMSEIERRLQEVESRQTRVVNLSDILRRLDSIEAYLGI